MPRLVTLGGHRVGAPHQRTNQTGDDMHDIENTFRNATCDANEAAHQMSVGAMSVLNANALALRAWSNALTGLASGMTQQATQLWRQQVDAIQQGARNFDRGPEIKPGQPGQPPRTVGAQTGTHG
jgi:hypothetical protein